MIGNRALAPFVYEGGGRAKRGRGEYTYIPPSFGLPLPLRGIPLINEGDKGMHLIIYHLNRSKLAIGLIIYHSLGNRKWERKKLTQLAVVISCLLRYNIS